MSFKKLLVCLCVVTGFEAFSGDGLCQGEVDCGPNSQSAFCTASVPVGGSCTVVTSPGDSVVCFPKDADGNDLEPTSGFCTSWGDVDTGGGGGGSGCPVYTSLYWLFCSPFSY